MSRTYRRKQQPIKLCDHEFHWKLKDWEFIDLRISWDITISILYLEFVKKRIAVYHSDAHRANRSAPSMYCRPYRRAERQYCRWQIKKQLKGDYEDVYLVPKEAPNSASFWYYW